LKHLDYTVGKTKGLPVSERQKILTEVFNSNLVAILSPEYLKYCRTHYPNYLKEWGNPKSEERLIKMRDFLATHCKKQKDKEIPKRLQIMKKIWNGCGGNFTPDVSNSIG
jgi:hypothetical protein